MATGSVPGMTTLRLTITLSATQTNVYAMAGTATAVPLSFPPAYQVAAPFGTNIGGVNPAFFAIANNAALGFAEFDSWLTIGIIDGSAGTAISASPGFDISAWSETSPIENDDAAIFYMDPGTMGPNSASGPIVMAQMTISATSGTASAKLQGRSAGDNTPDWEENVQWTW